MPDYGLCGKIVALPGNGDALASHLLDAAAALDVVPGCELYVVSRDPGDADAVWVMEVWESVEAHRGSLELEAVQKLIARARPLIASMGERFELQPIGGKGLRSSVTECDAVVSEGGLELTDLRGAER